MDATPTLRAMTSRRYRGGRPWTLAILLSVAALLIQACSDNSGPAGPSFQCTEARTAQTRTVSAAATCGPAPSTGHADTAGQIRVQVGVNPNTIEIGRRAGVTVFVTNTNGLPLPDKLVQLSPDVGTLDVTVGRTNAQGQFSSSLRIAATDTTAGKTSATVTAFVEGAVGNAVVNFAANPVLSVSPGDTTQAVTGASSCLVGGFSVQFTVSGGVPPYTFTVTGTLPGDSITQSGLYSVGTFTIPIGSNVADVVTVTDSQGNQVSRQILITCSKTPT